LVLLVTALIPRDVWGQWSALVDAEASRTTYDGYLPSGVYTLAPSVAYAGGTSAFRASGAISKFDSGHGSAFADLAGTAYQAPVGSGTIAVVADASESWYRSDIPAIAGLAGGRLTFPAAPAGVWVGAAGGGARISTVARAAGRVDGGLWGRVGPLTSTGSVTSTIIGSLDYTDFQAVERVDVPWDGASVAMTAGARAGTFRHGVGRWLNGELQVPIVRPATLIATTGSVPTDILRGYPGAHYLTVGLRLTTDYGRHQAAPVARAARVAAPSAFVVLDAGEGRHTLRFRESEGRVVSIAGDFTGWEAVRCREVEPGVYEVTVVVAAGTHHVDVQVDGGVMVVPPGLPSVADDFGGEAGLLVVP
jgi:hypothetical protein